VTPGGVDAVVISRVHFFDYDCGAGFDPLENGVAPAKRARGHSRGACCPNEPADIEVKPKDMEKQLPA
jgi:hypothetical protein